MKKCTTKSLWLLLCFLMSTSAICAQNYLKKVKNAKGIEVTYQSSYKGKTRPGSLLMTVSGDRVSLQNKWPEEKQKEISEQRSKDKTPITGNYIDYVALQSYRRAELPDGKIISAATPFEFGQGFTEKGEGKHLGLNCKIVRTSINSNTIEVWYTKDIPFRGTPQANVGVPDGLVLKVIRNGDMVQEATLITPLKKEVDLLPTTWGETMDAADYQYTINQSGVITVPVFDQQTICFNGAKLPDTLEEGIQYSAGGGTIILKKVKLPDYVKNRTLFAEVAQYSDGDAYDRTGSIFMIPTDKAQSFLDAIRNLNNVPAFHSEDTDYHGLVSTDNYDVPLELMRFFTGFGVRKFNHNKVKGQNWVDSVIYKTEITSLMEKMEGEAWIGAYIGNWDAKGHKLSLKLKYYPDEEHRVYNAIPLFNTVNYLEQAGQPYPIFMRNDSLTVKFVLKEPVKNARLYYLTTGHGGWGGGDEFNQKPNTIYLDGQKVISFIPWRDDCGTYRNWNPCSGNFSNGLSSSDLSRSNWCPGTVTNPEYIYLGDLEAGEHILSVKIPQGAPEGGSNSYWCISGTLIY
ncbi:MAG: glpgli family protein [Phocaeicola sp.]|uniref:PNGase F N-terminal domain-containing protein n=1 Tax=Phocaeicola sp. TaxID=2773926 RepID=UPI0023CE0DCD|nr:PNGase F N-terminal domain-containing protein [Phocaeicola sp.]MDE5677476.1 glpgli family protein [Phocaeicola sp.]MDE6180613.1 glpgli family protein [Phocaeicola sp.]